MLIMVFFSTYLFIGCFGLYGVSSSSSESKSSYVLLCGFKHEPGSAIQKQASVQHSPLLAHEQVLRHNDFSQLQVVSSIILSGAGLLVIKIGHNTPSSSFQPEHALRFWKVLIANK